MKVEEEVVLLPLHEVVLICSEREKELTNQEARKPVEELKLEHEELKLEEDKRLVDEEPQMKSAL